jgi:tRNA dimethylallyltransferase
MQVYREMNIGTAKPTVSDQQLVPHHCIDLVDPSQRFTVTQFQEAARGELAKLEESGNTALLVAGTGLYLTAVIDNLEFPGEWPDVRAELEENHNTTLLFAQLKQLDPVAAERIEPTNRRRMIRALEVCIGSGRPFSDSGPGTSAYPENGIVQIGLRWKREVLAQRIADRVDAMLDDGLLKETKALLRRRPAMSATARQALGYKEMADHIEGRASLAEAKEELVLRTRQFAVRQERWFRRDPRIVWFDIECDPVAEVAPRLIELLA